MRRALPAALLLSAAALALGGCATYSDQLRRSHQTAARGDWQAVEAHLDAALGVDRGELPEVWDSRAALGVLERGVVLQAQESWERSARDLSAAESELEIIDLKLDTVGKIGSYVYSDSAEEYRAPPIERLSLNAINLLNYLAMQDLAGAAVEARRYQVMRNYVETLQAHPRGRFGAYLAGFVFERLGEPARALRYYEDALEGGALASLEAAVARTAAHTSWRGPRVARVLERTGVRSEPPPTELLVVLAVGRTPIKVAERVPIGAALGLAGVYFTGSTRLLERSALKVVVYPELQPLPSQITGGSVRIAGREVEPELVTDLGREVAEEYEKIKPRILAAALTRLVARAAAAEGARVAGREATDGRSRLVALLAALGTEAVLVGLDRPDTRSWTFLPGRIFATRVPVAPGRHTVEVRLRGPGGATRELDVDVPEGGWAALVITEPR